jgi:hypothetical protein
MLRISAQTPAEHQWVLTDAAAITDRRRAAR